MKRRARPENAIQADIVGFLKAVLPPDHMPYANPNAARRTAGGKASNGVPGLKPGIPDLAILRPDSRIAYLEVKTDAGKLSPAQEAVISKMELIGTCVAVVRSIDDVRAALKLFGIATREAA